MTSAKHKAPVHKPTPPKFIHKSEPKSEPEPEPVAAKPVSRPSPLTPTGDKLRAALEDIASRPVQTAEGEILVALAREALK